MKKDITIEENVTVEEDIVLEEDTMLIENYIAKEEDMIMEEGIILPANIESRATSGTVSNAFRTGYKVQAVWSVNSQNVANNTSNVTVKVQLCSTGSSYSINASATKNGSVTINGTTYSFTFNASVSGNQTKTVYTKTVDIPHNSDGTKSFSLSATLGINVTLSGTYWGNVSCSGTGTLNNIPRTSSFSINTYSGTIGSTQFNITINRASSAFTHKVYYRFGSINWLGSSSATTSFSFTPALGDCSQIPSSTSGTATIVVETYNGSTYIGSSSANITLYVPDSIKPSFTSLGADIVASGASTSYGYVKGKSKCQLSVWGATGNQGSWITNYYISGGGYSSTQWQFTTGALTSSGTITFSAYIVDSRGRRSDTKTVSITVQDYMNPTISWFSAFRCNSGGTATDDGTYLRVGAGYSYSTLGGQNGHSTRVEFKPTNSSTWTNAGSISSGGYITIGSNGIATDRTYDVKFTLADSFTSVSTSVIIPTAFVTMDIKKGGKGIAFGKASETDNMLEIGMQTKITNNSLTISGNSKNLVAGTGGSDVYVHNSKSGKYLQLKDDGTLGYSDSKIFHDGHLPMYLQPANFNMDDLHWIKNQSSWNGGNKTCGGQISGGAQYDGAYNYGAYIQFGGGVATGQIYLPENNVQNDLFFRCTWQGKDANSHWKRVWHNGNLANPMTMNHGNGYWGMTANGSTSDWVRTTTSGIIPYTSGQTSSLGTTSWRFNDAHIGTVHAYSGIYLTWIEDRAGSANWCVVDNANGGNSQITLRQDTDNKGNLGHRNFTWNYANISSIGNTFSLDREITHSVSKFDNNDMMYNMVKDMNFYLEKEKSVDEFEEVLELKETEEYKNADENRQNEMIKSLEKSTPASYYYSKRTRLIANADELPFEVAPESHISNGSRTIENGAFMVGLASALQKAIEKIENLEMKVEELENKIEELENK